MNRTFFIRISIAAIFVFAAAQLAVSQLLVSSLRKTIAADFEATYSEQLALLVNMVRNDLLMSNYREARNRLARATLSSAIYRIEIENRNSQRESVFERQTETPAAITFQSLPVYFSELNDKWGEMIFSIDSSPLQGRIDALKRQTLYAQVALLIFLIVTVSILLWFLWDSGSELEEVFETILKGDSRTSGAPKLWTPLINHASELANEIKAINLMIDDFKARNENRKEVTRLIHDLKSPMSAIKIATAKIQSEDRAPVELIQTAITRIESMIKSTVESTNANIDQLNLNTQNIGQALREIEKSIADTHPQLILETSGLSQDAAALTSSSDFNRILLNLINNSVEAGARTVRLVLKVSGNFIYVIVSDDGKGMPQELIPLIGKVPISSGKANIEDSGSGIGLFGAHKLIKKWNGDLNVTSIENKGTQVLIALPKAD